MISKSQINACIQVGETAVNRPEWQDYGQYCLLREKGLRKQAFSKLSAFLEHSKGWSFDQKKEFVKWLCDQMDSIPDASYEPYPSPLLRDLFIPFFEEWTQREPSNPVAWTLKGRYGDDFGAYSKAIEIDPRNQHARVALTNASIGYIEHAMHHLPEYFIGDEQEAIKATQEAYEHLSHITDEELREYLLRELKEAENMLIDWMTFRKGNGTDFNAWCCSKGRNYRWIKAFYYSRK
jgi:tetratricopeptide (TPR) repeat protein